MLYEVIPFLVDLFKALKKLFKRKEAEPKQCYKCIKSRCKYYFRRQVFSWGGYCLMRKICIPKFRHLKYCHWVKLGGVRK